jgi:hypothetical protein
MSKTKKGWWNRDDITPRELANIIDWSYVQKSLKYYYGGNWSKSEEVFNLIKKTRKQKLKHNEKLTIKIGGFRNEEDDEFYNTSTDKYSLSFRKWSEIVNIPISQETLSHFKYQEILAHLIYEMTWYGTEKQSLAKGKKLEDIIKKNL